MNRCLIDEEGYYYIIIFRGDHKQLRLVFAGNISMIQIRVYDKMGDYRKYQQFLCTERGMDNALKVFDEYKN